MLDAPALCAQGFPYRRSNMKALKLAAVAAALFAASSAANAGATFDSVKKKGFVQCGVSTGIPGRSEEHTSELQSLMRISYAVFCLNKKQTHSQPPQTIASTTAYN